MRTSTSLTTFLLCGLATAQFGTDPLLGSMSGMTCSNGQVPTVVCADPVPEMCGCTCSDGATFSHERPSHLGPPAPPPPVVEPIRQLTGKPCTGEVLKPWAEIRIPRTPNSGADSQIANVPFEAPEDGVLVVSDAHGRCEHFEVYVDDRLVGETSGTGPLDFSACGLPDECMEKNGGQHGYFALPKGNYKLGFKWTKVTPACDRAPNGGANYQFRRKC
ncbi:hypothetical protein PSV08DRAFT_348170 [Bipolaris maydis]|uniref:uncharacterized protein n=1 Tax=Cochliobolus heterostrophus TaxID=5016 RepID=UPI0024D09CFF|nr:hypothetical protein PSV08DRAFT_348170 [Bipolaris maydis]KAJ6284378.1 hypothetical protein J3E71DRAFT_338736 [Bipolaris maydis]